MHDVISLSDAASYDRSNCAEEHSCLGELYGVGGDKTQLSSESTAKSRGTVHTLYRPLTRWVNRMQVLYSLKIKKNSSAMITKLTPKR